MNSKWRRMCPWVSSIRNVWCRSMRRRSVSWRIWWSYALSREPLGGGGEFPLLYRNPQLSYSLAIASLATGKIFSATA